MEPVITLYSTILLLGAAQGLFLALVLVNTKGGDVIAHRLLAILSVTFALDLGLEFLFQSRYLMYLPALYLASAVTSFMYGPLIYLYVRAVTSRSGFRFSGWTWGHFVPFVIAILLLIPFYNLSDAQLLAMFYSDADVDASIGPWIIGGLIVQFLPMPLIGSYVFLSFRRLVRHSRAIRDQFSAIERISLTWLRNLLIALCALYLISLVAVFFSRPLGIEQAVDNFFFFAVVIVIYAIGYMGIRQPRIFADQTNGSASSAESPKTANAKVNAEVDVIADAESAGPAKKKYQKSALDAEMSGALLRDLQQHMDSEKPYLDNQLTLNQLAQQMGISSNYLSQAINQQTGNHFFDLINQYRVRAAKRLLEDRAQDKTSILDIAMDAGFNSKSAFYTAFRRHMDLTPSQFRASLSAGLKPKPDARDAN